MATPSDDIDQQFMRRAIRLAMNGRGRVEPNPMVGCVIVSPDGRVIGEGYHARYGGPHAEPAALANCTEPPAGATAYVTLEPCCHTAKKTPPCVPRLIEARIARVVIGCLDPNPAVNGKGVAMLRAAGIRVDGPVLEQSAKQLIAPFLARLRHGRPYVTLKWAETGDRKIAGPRGARLQITSERSSRVVHQLRADSDGIVVGVNTVITDDPLLTARGVPASRRLIRFVLDSRLLTPETSNLVRTARDVPLVIFCRNAALTSAPERVAQMEAAGAVFVRCGDPAGPGIPLGAFFDLLATDGLEDLTLVPFTHVLVEPGPTLARSFLSQGLADRLWVFRSSNRVGDESAPQAVEVPVDWVESGVVDLAGDTLTEYLNPASPVFFAPEPSADFVLASERENQ